MELTGCLNIIIKNIRLTKQKYIDAKYDWT